MLTCSFHAVVMEWWGGMGFDGIMYFPVHTYRISSNTAQVSNLTRVNLPIQIEKF